MNSESVRLVYILTTPQSFWFLRRQARYVKQAGFEVYAVSSPGPELEIFAAQEGIVTRAISMSRRITPFQDIVSIVRVCRYIRKLKPHIIHASTPKAGMIGCVVGFLCRTPVRIYHVRGMPFMTATGFRRLVLKNVERMTCRLANAILCVSHSLRRVVIEEGFAPENKVSVPLAGSSNGVDAVNRFNRERLPRHCRQEFRARYSIPDGHGVIGFVGRIAFDKGVTDLLEAWRQLRGRRTDIHLLMVGPHERHDPLPRPYYQQLQEDPAIHLLGAREDLPEIYTAMDILVHPSYREGFPNVLLEAAAMQLPVVATDIPGCIDAVTQGVTGLIVPVHSPSALAEAIEVYLNDPQLRHRHAEAARETVLHDFQPEAIWRAVCQEYTRLLRRERVHRELAVVPLAATTVPLRHSKPGVENLPSERT